MENFPASVPASWQRVYGFVSLYFRIFVDACIYVTSNFCIMDHSLYREKNRTYWQTWLECAKQLFDGIFWEN
jgi:hypothetical protein